MLVTEPKVKLMHLPPGKLKLDDRVNLRAETHWVVVQEYAEAMEEGDQFPAVVVFHDGTVHWVADGFHRTRAALKVKAKTIPCEVHYGTRRDAMLYAAGCNVRHGVRRTNKDKRRAVIALLSDREWRQWNSAEIARRCAVSGKLVDLIRETMGDNKGETTYRLQFNGRGDIQYRQSSPRRAPKPKPKPEPAAEYCPTCGQRWPHK